MPEGGESSHFSLGDVWVGDSGFLLSLGGRLQTVNAVLHLASSPMPIGHCLFFNCCHDVFGHCVLSD